MLSTRKTNIMECCLRTKQSSSRVQYLVLTVLYYLHDPMHLPGSTSILALRSLKPRAMKGVMLSSDGAPLMG